MVWCGVVWCEMVWDGDAVGTTVGWGEVRRKWVRRGGGYCNLEYVCRKGTFREHWKDSPLSLVPFVRGPDTAANAVTPSTVHARRLAIIPPFETPDMKSIESSRLYRARKTDTSKRVNETSSTPSFDSFGQQPPAFHLWGESGSMWCAYGADIDCAVGNALVAGDDANLAV